MNYLISDTHFNHINIIDYEDRPFKDVDEMNSTIITNWNNMISNRDTIYHLGDFGWGNMEEIKSIIDKLNGYKILIMGNHDKRRSKTWWHRAGFNDVIEGGVILDNFYMLTHRPAYMNKHMPYINIHGHTHSNSMKGDQFINISVEKTGYKPIMFDLLKKKIAPQEVLCFEEEDTDERGN